MQGLLRRWFRGRHWWRDYRTEWLALLLAVVIALAGCLLLHQLSMQQAKREFAQFAAGLAGLAALVAAFGETTNAEKYAWRLTPWGVVVAAVLTVGIAVACTQSAKAVADAEAAENQANIALHKLQELDSTNRQAVAKLGELIGLLGTTGDSDSALGRLNDLRDLIGAEESSDDRTVFQALSALSEQLSQLPNAKNLAVAVTEEAGTFAATLGDKLTKPLTDAAEKAKPKVESEEMSKALAIAKVALASDLTSLKELTNENIRKLVKTELEAHQKTLAAPPAPPSIEQIQQAFATAIGSFRLVPGEAAPKEPPPEGPAKVGALAPPDQSSSVAALAKP